MSSRCRSDAFGVRHLALACAAGACLLLGGCEREQRRFDTPSPMPELNAYDVAQGKRLFRWFNCLGCHAEGGGGAIGPGLRDARWRYGASFDDVVATITQGRPNGMPAFGGRIVPSQIRQLAAYVRSMSGQLRTDVAPSRSDSISVDEPESRRDREVPVPDPAVPGARP